jgi:(hydroxyamino)benzene mutase
MVEIDHQLALAGIVLFLLGLLNGFVIALGRSPRLSLSAHLTGVQSGTFLIVMGVLWPHIAFPDGAGGFMGAVLWVSLYLLWLALCLAGLLGAGRGLPLAGGGIETRPFYQRVVSVLLIAGTSGTTLATAVIVFFMLVQP